VERAARACNTCSQGMYVLGKAMLICGRGSVWTGLRALLLDLSRTPIRDSRSDNGFQDMAKRWLHATCQTWREGKT
jgi:hypothetical protein